MQGNKVRKLRGYLELLQHSPSPQARLLSFGGAFSNHLAALAVAGKRYGFATLGIVRGEPVENPVLALCRQCGMELHFVSRSEYRCKNQEAALQAYQKQFGPAIIVPEGGSGSASKVGTRHILPEIAEQLGHQKPIDFIQLAAGTGGTATGIIDSNANNSFANMVEVFPILKGGWMQAAINSQLAQVSQSNSWAIIDDYHWGGYAKRPPELLEFCSSFSRQHGIPLEPIYTGKLFYGVLNRIKNGDYPIGATLVTYHSGGILFPS